MTNIYYAIGLTVVAGLSTGIGGVIAFFAKKTSTKFLSVALGFSAGVMVYISFVEIFNESMSILRGHLGLVPGSWLAAASFFSGMLFIAIIDNIIPSFENPHETKRVEDLREAERTKAYSKNGKLLKTGIITALAVAIHNFPEGFATFMSTVRDPALGIGITVAVAIHNIPEGISVSMPIYYATGSRRKALYYSLLSGFAEPLGALAGYLILSRFLNDTVFGVVFGAIAGIMVFISFDQLLPTAHEYGEHHLAVYGLVAGMAVMAASLIFFL